MGKGIIKSGGTGGQYTVDLVYDNSVATARKQTIQADIDDLDNNQIPAATTDKDNAQTTYNNAANDLNAYIASAGPVTVANAGEYQRQSAIVLNARAQYEFKLRFLNNLILRRNSLAVDLNKLNTNTSDTQTITAWCADLTEDLTGNVGLIEVGYERENPVAIIRPHALESAAYNAAKDGINTNFYNQSAHQIYTNRAYLPAMAKWKPRYRIGTLTAKSGDTGSVSLDALSSSQQRIDVNQSTTLNNVPIQYMTCNGDAFDVGDRVVVEFNGEWSTPKVIGFVSNPKECTQWPSYIDYKLDMSQPPILNSPGVCSDVISSGPIDYHYIAKDFDPDNPSAPAYGYGVFDKSEATESLFVGTLAIESTDFEVIEFAGYQNGAVVYSCTGTYVDWESIAEGETAHYEVYGMLNMDSTFFDTTLDVRKNTDYPYVIRGYDTASGHFIQTKITPPEILALLSQPRTTTILTLKNTLTGKTRQYEYYTSTQWLTVRTFRYWIKPV